MSLDCTPEQVAQIFSELDRLGWPKTRESVIIWCFGEVPDEWNEDRERQLPPHMQVWPSPNFALGH